MIRRAVLNVAVGGWYGHGSQRLFHSLEEHSENATRLFWRGQYPPGSPTHQEALYAFKPYAFDHARRLGFDQAVWVDASCWAVRDLARLWATITERGYYLEPDGHLVGNWCSDHALDILGIDRDEAMELILVEGKLIGLDLRDREACAFLDDWKAAADAGAFTGELTNAGGRMSADRRCLGHRGDIPAATVIADSLAMEIADSKVVWFPSNGAHGDDVVFLSEGM